MKRIWKDYFTFSKKERIAVIILLVLIACFIIIPYLYTTRPAAPVINKALRDFAAKMDSAATGHAAEDQATTVQAAFIHRKIFPFDPNTVSEEGWKDLGVSPKTAHTIINYRNKGGRFRLPADIRKIWGLRKEDADRLMPFVRIAVTGKRYVEEKDKTVTGYGLPVTGKRVIDINTATMEEWKTLAGIGDVLAARIMKFRDRIGGFTDATQVKKTYGISDSVFALISPWLKTDPATVPKMNLNMVSAYDLRIRTNIPEVVARAIVAYRQQYGNYQSVEDLKKIVFIKDSLFQKIMPYVRVE